MRGNVVLGGEPALADLLHAALVVQRHDLVGARAVDVRRRVVEREVAVLAYADARDVDRRGADERLKTADLGVGVRRLAVHLVERLHRLGGLGDEALAHVAAERGLVRDGDSDVFVEVEASYLRPVYAGLLDERSQELELARPRGHDDARLAARGDRLPDLVARRLCRGRGHVELVLAYVDLHDFLLMMDDGLSMPSCRPAPKAASRSCRLARTGRSAWSGCRPRKGRSCSRGFASRGRARR